MDVKLKCVDCGKEIILNEEEQKFYKEKKFPYPKRCKECREKRKQLRIKKSNHKIDKNNR